MHPVINIVTTIMVYRALGEARAYLPAHTYRPVICLHGLLMFREFVQSDVPGKSRDWVFYQHSWFSIYGWGFPQSSSVLFLKLWGFPLQEAFLKRIINEFETLRVPRVKTWIQKRENDRILIWRARVTYAWRCSNIAMRLRHNPRYTTYSVRYTMDCFSWNKGTFTDKQLKNYKED